jgi:NhaA family Na+:H+ antiporter
MAHESESRDVIDSRSFGSIRGFFRTESAGAILLAVGALVALVWVNSPWSATYDDLWSRGFALEFPGVELDLDLRHWLNDGVMTLFFFVVGLEIKRELTTGHLSTRRAATLPGIAALGGMALPAVLYLAIAGTSEPRGWAIPVATDIALAVGALSVAGSRVPTSLRAFLLALAIVDDIGAIVIIAIVYSSGVTVAWLFAAGAAVLVTIGLQRLGANSPLFYVIVGVWMWFALYEAGVHPTIAGVAMGLLTPIVPYRNTTLIDWLLGALHGWTSFLVVPLFAFANSGVDVSLGGLQRAATSPIAWGIAVGLVIGKPLGIMLATKIAVRLRVVDSPVGVTSRDLVGAGSAAGIGFTVAIFITELALVNPTDQSDAKLAILAASVVSAATSIALLRGRSSN